MPLPKPVPGIYDPPLAAQSLEPASLRQLTLSAHQTLKSHIANKSLIKTPLKRSTLAGNPFLKLETHQITRSFKARGALNKLHHAANAKAVVTASTGNHALAVAHAANVYALGCTIFVPENIKHAKRELLKHVDIRIQGADCLLAELAAMEYARRYGLLYVSPYNDLLIAAGQASLAYEILEDLGETARSVYITVGGGGLLTGVAAVLKPLGWRIVACQPENSAVMLRSVQQGRVVDVEVEETLSDGSAGGIEEDSVTFPYCRSLVDLWVVVSEEEILSAVRMMHDMDGVLIEGAAGVAVAGFLRDRERKAQQGAVIVVCGGNVDGAVLKR